MLKSRFLFVAVIFSISVNMFMVHAAEPGLDTDKVIQEFFSMSEDYVPPDDTERISKSSYRSHYKLRTIYIRVNIKDWERFSLLPEQKIISVRALGFPIFDKKKRLDITIKDPVICKNFSLALNTRRMFRFGYSDLGRSGGGYGRGGAYGVLQIKYKGVKKPVIIGVSQIGFFNGTAHGSNRNNFFSKSLARALEDALKRKANYTIPRKIFDFLTGESVNNLPPGVILLDSKNEKPSKPVEK